MRQADTLVGAIEGGGTRFICAVGGSAAAVLERAEIATTDAASTLGACLEFFRAAAGRHGSIAALGVGCFGPLQLRRDAPDYGCLLHTPKPGWSGVDLLAPFREAMAVPIVLDTDVGAAAFGELHAGAGQGQETLAYVTVGTGVGGAVAPAQAAKRMMHAEMGHLAVRRDPGDTSFAGVCPFHGDCLEGLASGPAIRARWGCDLAALPSTHPGRALIAGYIGQLAAGIALMHSPQILVIGGGVMADGSLLPLVRNSAAAWLAGYLPHLRAAGRIDAFIQPPALGNGSAIAGALQMALDCVKLPDRGGYLRQL